MNSVKNIIDIHINTNANNNSDYNSQILLNILDSIGGSNSIKKKQYFNDNSTHFIFSDIKKTNGSLPRNYILIQTMHLTSESLNKNFYNLLDKCIACWDFSMCNIKKYYNDKYKNKIYFLPPLFFNIYNTNINIFENDVYDLLFYGSPDDEKINGIISKINDKYRIIISTDIKLIKICKIVVFFRKDDGFIEINKYGEILNLNKIILSEKCVGDDEYIHTIYEDVVVYFDNPNKLINYADYYLDEINYIEKIDEYSNKLIKIQDSSIFHVHKNLTSIKMAKNNMCFDMKMGKIYCLHLIETPFRINAFNLQKVKPDVLIYPAVKASIPWIGCGMSYQNMIWNAKRCGLSHITICEDDCSFKNDFFKKYDIIKSFLDQYSSGWDIFVGCIANLPVTTKISNVVNYGGMTFLEIDKMYSMVFNIYNSTSYDTICNWNSSFENYKRNSIDIYLKGKNLKIITTNPFEFECINIKSTLWGINMYDKYNDMFTRSKNTIEKKINEYYKKSKNVKKYHKN